MTDTYIAPPDTPRKWGPAVAAAFCAAQAEMPDITKGRTAKVETKTGGSYSYKYADLSDLLEAVRPVLSKHSLFVSQDCIRRASMIDVYTTVGHASGECVDFGPMSFEAGGTPQSAGSAVTYARRYALLAALGMATEDDDGQAAAQAPKSKPAPKAAPPEPTDPGAATDKQTRAVFAALKDRGFTERDAYLAELSRIVGRTLGSSKELTKAEAGAVIDTLNGGQS